MYNGRMTDCHHMVTLSGRSHYDLESTLEESQEFLGRVLSRLDGTERYSLVLGPLPPGRAIDQIDLNTWRPPEYLQCAGSSEAMTVEIRTGFGGEAKQYVVGRSETHTGEPDTDIPWNGYVSSVYPDEVFDADQAIELFAYYLVHATVPPDYSLRCLDLSRPTTRPR
jgi:hypothetical protein